MLGVSDAIPMDIFQDDMQQWGDRINAAVLVFREQMEMIIEARNNVAQCQQVIMQQANQIACLQAQGAGPSTAQGSSSTTYLKKVEISTTQENMTGPRQSLRSGGQRPRHGSRSMSMLFQLAHRILSAQSSLS